jgi:hypothetical protein
MLVMVGENPCGMDVGSKVTSARMVWAMMARGERYKEPVALAV